MVTLPRIWDGGGYSTYFIIAWWKTDDQISKSAGHFLAYNGFLSVSNQPTNQPHSSRQNCIGRFLGAQYLYSTLTNG